MKVELILEWLWIYLLVSGNFLAKQELTFFRCLLLQSWRVLLRNLLHYWCRTLTDSLVFNFLTLSHMELELDRVFELLPARLANDLILSSIELLLVSDGLDLCSKLQVFNHRWLSLVGHKSL